MAEPTPRERELAKTIDLALIEIEERGYDNFEHTQLVRELLATKLADYRAEIAGRSEPADGDVHAFVDIEEALRALAARPEEHDDGR